MVTEDPQVGDDRSGEPPRRSDTDTHEVPLVPRGTGAAGIGGYPVGRATAPNPAGSTGAGTAGVSFEDHEFEGAGEAVDFSRGQPLTDPSHSALVGRYLFPTERYRGEWRRHWIHLARVVGFGVLATFVLGYISGYFAKHNLTEALAVLVLIWLAVMVWLLWTVVEWYYDRFVLTNKRVMLVEGVVARKVAMMPLARVTDMKYTQTALGRVLGYGTFEIESAGQEQALRKVENLPNPTELYLQVVEEMYEPEASEAKHHPAPIDGGDDGT
jgi:membrane protein YdbS with pleckstrin-like domain